jgi:hypothetical protein
MPPPETIPRAIPPGGAVVQTKAGSIDVKRAKDPDGTLEDPPDGLEVHLAQPGQGTLTWEKFTVKPGTPNKVLEPTSATPTIKRGVKGPFWCVWSASSLSPGTSFDKVAGFGWPLLARFVKGSLVLPNTREVTLLYFNLSGQKHDPNLATDPITADLNLAKKFYEDLHVRLVPTQGTVPAKMSGTLNMNKDSSKSPAKLEIVKAGTATSGYSPITPIPDLGDSSWGLPSDLAHTVIAYWVNEFTNTQAGVRGMAWPLPQLTNNIITVGENWTHPNAAFIFLPLVMSGAATQNRVAHEIGHVLLYEPGLGTTVIENQFKAKSTVMAFLAKLGLEGPTPGSPAGSTAYGNLPVDMHKYAASTGNLMGPAGGANLADWQVAVLRASKQVGDGP